MCHIPNYEEDEQEMDECLTKMYRIWRGIFADTCGDDIPEEDLQEMFFSEAKVRLKDLLKEEIAENSNI